MVQSLELTDQSTLGAWFMEIFISIADSRWTKWFYIIYLDQIDHSTYLHFLFPLFFKIDRFCFFHFLSFSVCKLKILCLTKGKNSILISLKMRQNRSQIASFESVFFHSVVQTSYKISRKWKNYKNKFEIKHC